MCPIKLSLLRFEIDAHIRQFPISQNERKPRQRVLFNPSFGSGLNEDATTLTDASCPEFDFWNDVHWANVDVIAAISDLGKNVCIRMPFILEDVLLSKHFNLKALFFSFNDDNTSHDAELVKKTKNTSCDLYLPKPMRYLDGLDFIFEEHAHLIPNTLPSVVVS